MKMKPLLVLTDAEFYGFFLAVADETHNYNRWHYLNNSNNCVLN